MSLKFDVMCDRSECLQVIHGVSNLVVLPDSWLTVIQGSTQSYYCSWSCLREEARLEVMRRTP